MTALPEFSITRRGARLAGRLAGQLGWWLGQRGGDAVRWPVNLVYDLPGRAHRLAHVLRARTGSHQALPVGLPSAYQQRRFAWALVLGTRVFDLAGGPELAELLLRSVTQATPLTGQEQAAAAQILGPAALRWSEVRVAEGGVLACVFRYNGNRAFATWHTINLPLTGRHTRARLDIVIHELVHVYQYERIGSAYIVEALIAQHTTGYDYGGVVGLNADRLLGRRYCHYNREQQAQIVQDYFLLLGQSSGTVPVEDHLAPDIAAGAAYALCLAELQAGEI